ncbi:helix-turn-helix domain-containing protein [Bradyrhizobium sp. Tv2a-2]|uniref:helix-turn-helix domain-containing protein n=1 Tax=Bradyrhizobium sp. Tv2a-2 TaxID=113395 RepID=UPI0006857FD0|nr:helix-turn-helix domain-containing protein [Bradyrhizobium sp. Tv2a-2]
MSWIRTREIKDPAACHDAFVNSDFEAFPKETGDFLCKLIQIGMDRVWMARYSLSLPQVDVFSIRPERTVIGFLTDSSSSVRYCGAQILPGDIIINRASEAHQQTDRGFHGGTMSLPSNELNAAVEAVVGCDFVQKLAKPIIRPSPALMSRLLKLHKAVGQLAHDNPEIIELPEVCRALDDRLLHLMVRCLAEGAGVEATTGGRRHDAIIAKFEEYLAAHPDRPLYLTEICAGIGVAERTLRAACDEHLGMGPIRYLTLRRMHLVRRALLGAEAKEASVTRIVTDHGFWELGRFSVAYRTIFGESPSETLRRPADRQAAYRNRPSSLPADAIAGGLS